MDIDKYLDDRPTALWTTVYEWTPEEFKGMCSPGVYIFASDTEVLYVGYGVRMIHRATDPNHERAKKSLTEATKIRFLPCVSERRARTQEAQLISELQPKYNIAGLKIPIEEYVEEVS